MNKVICDCGKEINAKTMKKHLKSKFHNKHTNNANVSINKNKQKINEDKLFFIAKKTCPRNYQTINGKSKNQEYLQIEGVPVIVVKSSGQNVVLNSLTSSHNRNFTLSLDELKKWFIPAVIENDKIINCSKYPDHIPINEFKHRNEFDKMMSDIKNKFIKKITSKRLQNFINDKIFQMIQSQGSTKALTLKEYYDFQNKKLKLTKHKRIGDPIFNRNSRWCPPISEEYTYEEFEKSPSFPAPIGVRSKDFCMPSQLISTIKELIKQSLCFTNVDKTYMNEFMKIFPDITYKHHKCRYCGVEIDISKYDSRYKSKNNYIELCHRDPNFNYSPNNVYWGHGECNRKQGGYDEWSRVKDGLNLIQHNWTDFTNDQKEHIKDKCKLISNFQ